MRSDAGFVGFDGTEIVGVLAKSKQPATVELAIIATLAPVISLLAGDNIKAVAFYSCGVAVGFFLANLSNSDKKILPKSTELAAIIGLAHIVSLLLIGTDALVYLFGILVGLLLANILCAPSLPSPQIDNEGGVT